MKQKELVNWKGKSGRLYAYIVYPIHAKFNKGQDGNYVYSKIFNGSWQPVYIGQGDLGDRADIDLHHQSKCLKSKGVTHVHVHLNHTELERLSEERDLLASYPQAYLNGCNIKPGG